MKLAAAPPPVPSDPTTPIVYTPAHVTRSRAYHFVLDAQGAPIELGSGRFAKAFLGEEEWLQSKTAFRRRVAIKMLQRGVSAEDALRFQMEKELIERAQGHPNIIGVFASGEADNPAFIPPSLRDRVENDFIILELCDLSLEERLKGARRKDVSDDLLAYPMRERLFRVLEYMLPVAAAVEYSHLQRDICHRDIKPANVLLKLPDKRLQGGTLDVRLADFNVGKLRDDEQELSVTRLSGVPGTLFFQSPEQETNTIEVLASVQRGSAEVEYFEDFYMYISPNDTFQIFNRPERYAVERVDRARKRILLEVPFGEPTESHVRAKVVKSVDRPADIYSLGAMFYYLISGAYANPKALYDAFHKFIEYEQSDAENTIDCYLEHEYRTIGAMRAPKQEGGAVVLPPADRFFTYKHYLDGNGELIDHEIMRIVAKAMVRNKVDSYCQAWDETTAGIQDLVVDLVQLYQTYGAGGGPSQLHRYGDPARVRRTRPGFFRRLLRK